MFSTSKKPFTAITVHIERLTGPEYEENDFSGLVDLIEVIRIQDTGPTEAARAIRKKLKYGTSARQLRALTLLDGLIQNAGNRFQRTFADEPLLERLRNLPRDDLVDPAVAHKATKLFRQWSASYSGQPGLAAIAGLYKELPRKSRPTASQSKVLRETERLAQEDANPFAGEEGEEGEESEVDGTPTSTSPALVASRQPDYTHHRNKFSLNNPLGTPLNASSHTASIFSTSSSKNKTKAKKAKRGPFDLQRETPQILQSIASSSIASTNLLNALKFVNREAGELPSTSQEVMCRFDTAKMLRRQILRYIQLVEDERWIGGLLSANDELVRALMAWEVVEKGVEDDSDSDVEIEGLTDTSLGGSGNMKDGGASVNEQMRGLRLGARPEITDANSTEILPAKPPRPTQVTALPTREHMREAESDEADDDEPDDENDPFGDHAAIK